MGSSGETLVGVGEGLAPELLLALCHRFVSRTMVCALLTCAQIGPYNQESKNSRPLASTHVCTLDCHLETVLLSMLSDPGYTWRAFCGPCN